MFLFRNSTKDGDKSGKGRIILIVGGALLGILLLLLGSGALDGNTEAPEESVVYDPTHDEMLIYQAHLEERVKALCETVGGVEGVTAIVMLENGYESVYATEYRNGEEQYVIIGSGSSSSALFLTEATPTICGIGIVCNGGNDPTVRRELISLLSATFHISTNRIYVTGS